MEQFGASPALTPSEENANPFDGDTLTPATAVVQDPFEKNGSLTFMTPISTPSTEPSNPIELVKKATGLK